MVALGSRLGLSCGWCWNMCDGFNPGSGALVAWLEGWDSWAFLSCGPSSPSPRGPSGRVSFSAWQLRAPSDAKVGAFRPL